ncbi:peptidoglycan-binding domain-containing protein [Phytomonospora endophytica]|uniref:Peptidoglycan binding-like domain-containing protein n=1 Tax=Phytomonospora endophytica TaxID=714109 RepID=A0A841FJU8_9ACTN|nr:hypothetical protein [Phytomonospora endophytica]MBB6036115.1 hypothetical protein [Phytomonospora endophytica]GIG67018.1 hypothetical protein Pen01_33130 [Phytomonospora endophytica]
MRALIKAALTGAVVIMATLAVAAPAEASPAEGMVKANVPGPLSDDWKDEGVVDRNTRAYSAATGLWQAVLWADGAIERDGTRYDESDIDCEFGPNTQAATRNWQSVTGGLAVDGSAGPLTWGRADDNLSLEVIFDDGAWLVRYYGRYAGRSFQLLIEPNNGTSVANAYYTWAWGGTYFYYGSKPSNCSGVPF